MKPMRHLLAASCVCALSTLLLAQAPGAPAANEYGRAPKLGVVPFQGPNGRVRFEYPKSGWQVVPGGSSVLVSLRQKGGEAAVVVEQNKLNQPLAPDDITDLFGQLEADVVKERQPTAANIESKVVEAGGRRFVILTYARQGIKASERVRQYSIPSGSDLFRLTCSAAADKFAKYESVFAHVAASFTVAAPATQ